MKNATVFTSLNLLYKAMLAGQVIFTAVMFVLVYKEEYSPVFAEYEKTIQVAALVFSALAIFIGNSLFKKKLALINEQTITDSKTKLTQYRSASFMQWALLEAGCLVNGICLFLTGNYAFLALAAVLLLYFAMLVPVKNKIAAQLNLQTSDLDEL